MLNLDVTSTAQNEQLFILIKSLNKAEKRNFKLYANRLQSKSDVKFVQLFDVLDKSQTYDGAIILKKMKGLNKSQLANLKRHLYKQILISLRLIHIQKNVDIEIREQIDFAKILYGKGLYLQSLKLLDRIKTIAYEHHQDILHLEIMEFQKLIEERHITRSRKIKNKVEDLVKEAASRSAIIHNTCKLSNLKIEIHGFYIQFGHAKSRKDSFVVQELFKSQLNNINIKGLSFFEKVYLYQSHVWYYYILLDFQNCYKNAAKWVKVFNQHPNMIEEDPDLYMRGLHYVLTCLYNMGDYEKFVKYLNQFEDFNESYGDVLNATSSLLAFIYTDTSKINKHFMEGSFSEGVKLIPEILKSLKTFEDLLDPHRIMVYYYKIAYLYLGNADYNKALDYLNHIINLKLGHLREDIQCYARLLYLITHYEMGNYDLLEYETTNVQRFMEKLQDQNEVQLETIKFIKRLINVPIKEQQKIFSEFKPTLQKLAKDHYAKRAFLYLDVLIWVDSKIQNQTLAEMFKRKYIGK